MMTKTQPLKLLSATLLLLMATLGSAPAHSESLFDIELVFFKRLDVTGEHNHLGKDSMPDFSVKTAGSPILSLESLPENYQIIPAANRKLEGTYRALRSSAKMRPLLHLAWRQPLKDKAQSAWIRFKVSDEPEKQGLQDFTGFIRLSRNQGLLVENFITGFRASETQISKTPAPTANNGNTRINSNMNINEQNATEQPLYGYFVLSENRKVKINKLHYFDNPTMGVLVKITPYRATLAEQESLE